METRSIALVVAVSALTAQTLLSTAESAVKPAIGEIELHVVDPEATGYATFQSHNQKVVSNARGIFEAHIRSRNEAYTAQQWRLSRSTDGGKTWKVLFQDTLATNPPVLETDPDDNVYLARPDFQDGSVSLYRFRAANDYAKPSITKIPGAAAGKFAMHIDLPRKQLYYFSHNNTFHIVGLDGKLQRSYPLLKPGKHAVLQYPLLSLAKDGTLHAAWTTQKHGVYLYWDIHHMVSPDAGRSWRTLAGEPVEIPAVADDTGSVPRITLDDEFESHTWLSNLLIKDGKAHFLYLAQTKPPRQHYVRYDIKTGKQDARIQPEFRGETISLSGLSGFFATTSAKPGSPLYCVSRAGDRIGCLVSLDNGRTWHDHALSRVVRNAYSVGGCREVTVDGHVIGTFTEQVAGTANVEGKCPVFFLKIRAGR